MKKLSIALITVLGISLAAMSPAKAQFWGVPYYGGWGGWYGGYGGYGYGAAALGAGLAVGAIAGAIAASNQPYYDPYYGPYYEPAPRRVYQKKQIIIRNSPGARVVEQEYFGW